MLQNNYDVVIVGAGPGGSATAKRLAERGLKVALLEKRQEIGVPKRCGEGLSLRSAKAIWNNEIPRKCIAQDINGAIVYAPNGNSITISGDTNGYVLERKIFDKWLAMEASRAGVYVQAKTEVTDIIKENDYVVGVKANFEGQEYEIRAKVVVAADGVESKIARKVGMNTTNQLINIDSGFQYEMSNINLTDKNKLELFFGEEIAPRGYIWIFPKGDHVANVGIGVSMCDKTAKYYLDKWIENNPRFFKDASIVEVNSGGIPVGGLLENMVMNGFAVVGDAAHQVNPIHGGGIKEASVAGKILGDVIADAIAKDDVSKEALSPYNKLWWDERGNKLMKVQKLREVFDKISDKDMNMISESITGQDLLDLSSGNKMTSLVKILMKNPKLLGLAKHLM